MQTLCGWDIDTQIQLGKMELHSHGHTGRLGIQTNHSENVRFFLVAGGSACIVTSQILIIYEDFVNAQVSLFMFKSKALDRLCSFYSWLTHCRGLRAVPGRYYSSCNVCHVM